MGVICKYKYDSSIYADLIPEFNSGYSSYVITDEVEGNIITRTIESETLPTLMRFGRMYVNGETATDNRTDSLLEVLDMNTSGLTTMQCMFRYNKNLTSITCNWNTSNVVNMYYIFYNCNNLTSLDVSNWDTGKVIDMNRVFDGCSKLTSLDVSNWDTGNVTNMQYMFNGCYNLTSLDVSNWNTSNVTTMSGVFNGCTNLTSLDVSNWNTSNVTTMGRMFGSCKNLASLDLSNWNTSNVIDMGYMFSVCEKLTSLNVSNWDTSNVIDMTSMFYKCYSLTTLDVSNFDTSKVTDMTSMFYNCNKLTTLDVSNWDTSKVANTTNMFANTNSLEVITMFNNDINTINAVGNLTSATLYVDESLDQSQYTGTAPLKVYKEEKLEIKLNSPLLEGDTIEVVDGKLCHVHRWEKVVLNGSENWVINHVMENNTAYYTWFANVSNETIPMCDKFKGLSSYLVDEVGTFNGSINTLYLTHSENTVEGLKQWLQSNPTTMVYKLASPIYEDITPLQSSITLKTFLESSMIIDTDLPIETKLSYRTNVPSISTLSTRATELAESDNVIHNLMNIIDDEVDE